MSSNGGPEENNCISMSSTRGHCQRPTRLWQPSFLLLSWSPSSRPPWLRGEEWRKWWIHMSVQRTKRMRVELKTWCSTASSTNLSLLNKDKEAQTTSKRTEKKTLTKIETTNFSLFSKKPETFVIWKTKQKQKFSDQDSPCFSSKYNFDMNHNLDWTWKSEH